MVELSMGEGGHVVRQGGVGSWELWHFPQKPEGGLDLGYCDIKY